MLAVFGLSVTACSVPDLRGAHFKTEHYQILTDQDNQKFAKNIGLEAERLHETLSTYFQVPGDTTLCRIQIATRSKSYKKLRRKDISSGEFHTGFMIAPTILVNWQNSIRGREILSHEIVHHFVEEYMPNLNDWKNEGLALALEGSSVPLEHTRVFQKDQPAAPIHVRYWPVRDHNIAVIQALQPKLLKKYFDAVQEFDKFRSSIIERNIIALVIRYGLETQNWRTLRALKTWSPDYSAFRSWLLKPVK